MFADRLSAVLESTSAVPLEELHAGLLELRPFRFGSPFSSSSSLSSSASSASPSSPTHSDLEEGDGGGDGDRGSGSGETGVDATGDSRQRARTPADDPVAENGAARRAGQDQKKRTGRGEEDVPVAARRGGGPTNPLAARASAQAGAPPPASGSRVDLSSAGRHPGGRDKPRSKLTTADTINGWVRSRSSKNSLSRGGGRRGRSGAPTTPHTAGCWMPPLTCWGGTPIRSPLSWGGEVGTAARMGGGKEGDGGCLDTGYDRRSRGSPIDFDNGGELEWEGKEEGMENEGGRDFEIKDAEFFRTADGRSLFAESLSGIGGKTERVCHAIQWGEDGDSDDQGHHRRGFLCLLGEEGRRASERGSPDGRRLGVAARRRRARIDTRSRDGKRRAEMMFAREKIKRLGEEVILVPRTRRYNV